MADKQPIDKPMELPAELGDWREVLRLLHVGLKPKTDMPKEMPSMSLMGDKSPGWIGPLAKEPPVKGATVSIVSIAKPKDAKEAKKRSVEPIDMSSPLAMDGSPLRMMVNAMRSKKK